VRLDSVRSLKTEVSVESQTDVAAYHATTGAPMPDGLALGVGTRDDGEYVLSVRTADPAVAQAMSERAHGEADVRLVSVAKRATPAYFQARRRPLEPGLQVAMAARPFVGTLGCFVRDAAGLYALSNAHVLADEGAAQPGHKIGQPSGNDFVAALTRYVPLAAGVPNIVDAAIARLDPALPAVTGYTLAISGNVRGARALTPDDLNRPVYKAGRTTGVRAGFVTSIEIDGLPVAYDVGVLRFNDQHEISGGPTTDFSQPGDSGSLIVDGAGWAVGLLFAGGRDSTGEDHTYANPILAVLSSLGVTLA
jgi:hypothetical protein